MQPERPAQTTLAFHSSRIVIDVGVLLAMASMSFPFVTSAVGGRSALQADAFPTILLLLPVFIVTLIPDHTRPLHPLVGWGALAFGLTALPYAIVKLLDARILADTLDGSLGFGAALMVIGCVVTLSGIGIGIFRDWKGLPAGGTPRRSATFRTRSSRLAAPGAERAPAEPKSPSKQPAGTPTRSEDSSSPTGGKGEPETPATPPVAPEAEPEEDPLPPPIVAPQAEIIFADEGAAPREAEEEDDELMTTAERADAAIDDHLLSMFETEDEPDDD